MIRCLSLVVGLLLSLSMLHGQERPNIVLIMADDMGYSDIGCYGGEIQTPNIDRLAQNGLRFTQFYNTGRCCPTRASLMTGLYPHQAGVGWMIHDHGLPGYRGQINDRCATIAEVLGEAGYGTYMAGKWHLSHTSRPLEPNGSWPIDRGFDHHFGTITGAGSFYTPKTLVRDDTQITEYGDDFYYTTEISKNAARYIREHDAERAEDPLFLYVGHTAPHWPLHALPEDIAKYRGKYKKGWDKLREERRARMIEMGLIKEDWPLTERDPKAKAWDELSPEEQDDMDMRMAIYAAMIDSMDQGVGRIVEALKETGRFDNTLILFLADNGGCAEHISRGEVKMGAEMGGEDSYESYRLPWANASNTPFREYKHWVHEGGISIPLVAHWPAKIKDGGELRHTPGHLIDIMATAVDIGEAAYPQARGGKDVPPMEGRSLTPVFEGRPIEREAIYWEHETNRAVRQGKWKLVAKGLDGAWELYDMEADRTETNDLSATHPERAKRMADMWQAWAERADVLPLDPNGWYKSDAEKNKRTKKAEWDLSGVTTLADQKAPHVQGEPFKITAKVAEDTQNGVVVAYGGYAHGFALYLEEGKPRFALRRDSALTTVAAGQALSGEATITAELAGSGAMTLRVNGEQVGSGKAVGTLTTNPVDALSVGADNHHPVADYQSPFQLDGEIKALRLKIGQ